MNILVTGATGYLGSHLVRAFLETGHRVTVLKRSFSDTARIGDLLADVSQYDLDRCSLEAVFRDQTIDAIVHAATCYGRQGESVGDLLRANVEFPARLLEVASSFGVPNFINTDTCLDKFLNGYSLSKKQFTDWGRLLAGQRQFRFLNLVLEHFYGPGEDGSRFVSFVIGRCLQGGSEIDLTAGEQTRDFIYVDDVVRAYLTLLAEVERVEARFVEFELGSGKAVSIRHLVETIQRLTESDARLNFGALPYRKGEQMHSCADIRALRQLGWSPRVSLLDGLEKTIAEERIR
jgi:nucleoside-diphosphate-sugar epimerase